MEDDLKTKHNEMINNIINKCHDMIRKRHYMNDFAIKCYAEDIIQIMDRFNKITITTKNNGDIILSSSSDKVYKDIKNKLIEGK